MRVRIMLLTAWIAAFPIEAFATDYAIHLAGMCSTSWPQGKGGGTLGLWPNVVSIDAAVDETTSVSQAAAQLRPVLDQYCRAPDSCWIFNYSAGDNILNYLLSNSAAVWNINYVVTTAGAGGGSNLAGDVAAVLTCGLASELTHSNARGAYNHNDTGGVSVYRIGGNKRMTSTNAACVVGTVLEDLTFGLIRPDLCLPGKHDGVVEYHSSGAYLLPQQYTSFWQLPTATYHWGSGYHLSYWLPGDTDVGEYLNHYELKMFGICVEGGVPGYTTYSSCVSYSTGR